MPNLMLTNWCNYKCPYCFGMDRMVPAVAKQAMTDETFLGILSWLDKTNYRRPIHLMGGEPTLHPKFEWIVNTLLERDFPITVFSNLASEPAPIYADKLGMLPIAWVVNVNPPYKWTAEQRDRIEASLAALGERASITFNVMPGEDDNFWALDLVRRFKLAPNIKVGFVLPTLTQANYALSDDEYGVVAGKVVELAKEAAKEDIVLQYECGVPTCAFTDEQLGILWKCGSQVRSGCCSRLDITPTGEVIYCLSLATVGSRLYSEFENYEAAKDWFEQRFAPYRKLGRKVECATCNLMNPEKCNGACLAKNLIGVKNLNL
ncbi:MAG: hypothetical protein E7137_04535 [Rikenellaceae bacterium]|nr:hypothetical protein [Rikenellaceae bacterium]